MPFISELNTITSDFAHKIEQIKQYIQNVTENASQALAQTASVGEEIKETSVDLKELTLIAEGLEALVDEWRNLIKRFRI